MNIFSQKIASRFTISWMIGYNIGIIVCVTISLCFLNLFKDKLNGADILFWLQFNHYLVYIGTITTMLALIIFRKKLEKLLQTIKGIANGDFVIRSEEKQDDSYGEAYHNLSCVVEELRGSKEEMEQFTNEFLHEIKTPLTSIHGFAELLIETGDSIEEAERLKYLRIISEETTRLSELSQNTLLLAKMDACQIVTDKKYYDMGEQIKKCVILLLNKIEEKHIVLDVDVEQLAFYGNKEFMEQVWINLIDNAVKFTPNSGKIKIQGYMDEIGIHVMIQDNGCGMDEETKMRLFEKFYQGKSGRQKGGNGIGLSIVYRIVTLCNGSIRVQSTLDEGTTFLVSFPK